MEARGAALRGGSGPACGAGSVLTEAVRSPCAPLGLGAFGMPPAAGLGFGFHSSAPCSSQALRPPSPPASSFLCGSPCSSQALTPLPPPTSSSSSAAAAVCGSCTRTRTHQRQAVHMAHVHPGQQGQHRLVARRGALRAQLKLVPEARVHHNVAAAAHATPAAACAATG